ncbi:MAG: dihydrofolate reductase, partial [Bacteroidota bacterium]
SCIMGRKTLLSIGRALPGRQMVVMSREANLSENFRAAVEEPAYFRQCLWARSPREALALCSEADPVWVIGGAEIYRVMEEHAHFIERTEVEGLWPEAQARFPLDPNRWTMVNSGEWLTSSSGLRFRYQRLERTAI